MNKGRVETFSDGVFAIAITLLVLTISPPIKYDQLGSELAHRWPSLAAYVVSFLVIGIMWVNHHTVFGHLRTIDRSFFYWNLVLLMTIVFVPYPTEVLGEALRKGQGEETAAIFYSATMTFNACVWSGMWLSASVGRRLLNDEFPEAQRTIATLSFTGGVLLYAIAIGLAVINPYLSLAFQAALAIYYALDPISRRVTRARAG